MGKVAERVGLGVSPGEGAKGTLEALGKETPAAAALAPKAAPEAPKPEGMEPPAESAPVKAAAAKAPEHAAAKVDESVKMPKVTGETVLPASITAPARGIGDGVRIGPDGPPRPVLATVGRA